MTTPIEDDGLLPCPICGSAFLISQEPHDNHPVAGMFYIYHEYGPLGSAARSCPIEVHKHFDTRAEAISAWNQRSLAALRSSPAVDGVGEPVAWHSRVWLSDQDKWGEWTLETQPYASKFPHLRIEDRPLYTRSALSPTSDRASISWDIEEFKIWKGIDPDKPQWHGRGFACPTWEAAAELMDYLSHNDPALLLRVGRFALSEEEEAS